MKFAAKLGTPFIELHQLLAAHRVRSCTVTANTATTADAAATTPGDAVARSLAVNAALDLASSYTAVLAAHGDHPAIDPWGVENPDVETCNDEAADVARSLRREHISAADRVRHLRAATAAAQEIATSWMRWAENFIQILEARPGTPRLPSPTEDWESTAVLPAHIRLDRATELLHQTVAGADAIAAAYARRARALAVVLVEAEDELLALRPAPPAEILTQGRAAMSSTVPHDREGAERHAARDRVR